MTATWSPVEKGFADTSYTGAIPARLYRYRGVESEHFIERLDQEIGGREIYLSSIANLNDDDEGQLNVRFDGTDEEIVRYFIDKFGTFNPGVPETRAIAAAAMQLRILRQNGGFPPEPVMAFWKNVIGKLGRVACFTENPLDLHMWSEYGVWRDGSVKRPHGGLCIGYAAGEEWRLLGVAPVTYSDARPHINPLTWNTKPEQLRDAMFVKGTRWSREHEWRIFLNFKHTDLNHPDLAKFSRLHFDEADVAEVVLGADAPKEVVDHVLAIAGRRKAPLSVLQVVTHDDEAPSTRQLL